MVGLLDRFLGGATFPAGAFPAVPIEPNPDAEEAREVAAARLRRPYWNKPLKDTTAVPFTGIMESAGLLSPNLFQGMEGYTDQPGYIPEQGTSGELPPSTNDPESAEPVVFKDGVPLPRPRPVTANQPASDVSSQSVGAPLSIAPPTPQAPAGAPAPSGVGGIMDKLFRPENAPLFFSLAGGFAGAPSIGTGMRRAFTGAVPAAMNLRKEQQTLGNQAETYRALVQRGVSPVEAMAALRNPELLKALIGRYFETKNAQVVEGRLVREKPGGGVEVLADFSDATKNAPSGYEWAPGGELKHIKGGPADPTVKRALGERQNAPPGYRWVDPEHPDKGMVAIPGGPGEKVDAQVAARLGLAQSFLDQLPSIRKAVSQGDATGAVDAVIGRLGYGKAGELRRQIDSGSEALLRNLTGAGMNMQEASEYTRRYKMQPHDTVSTLLSKLDQLERELRYTMEAVSKGRGGTPAQFRVKNGRLDTGDAAEAPAGLGVDQETEIDGVRIRRVK